MLRRNLIDAACQSGGAFGAAGRQGHAEHRRGRPGPAAKSGNPLEDLNAVTDQANLKIIMKDGKVYKNTLN
jgi:hypothetical protein